MTAIATILVALIILAVIGAVAIAIWLVPVVSGMENNFEWRSQARCANIGVSDFFAGDPATVRDLCGTCPVRAQCYQAAQSNHLTGYWGGTTPVRRRSPLANIRHLFMTALSMLMPPRRRAVAPPRDAVRP